ncbi:hypothetical protein CL635_01000 [bacterium]|jgi:hypothetical protein|nr:hypothetical protein [bacterium]|tara:strand:+ start:5696 stop:6145 length:450 start_codon:yes stop_codon:yes gene_type:complete
MNILNTHHRVSRSIIIITWLVYAIASHRLIVITSGGWMHFLNKYLYGAIYIIATLILIPALYVKRKEFVNIDVLLILFIISVQCMLLLLNYGDCLEHGGAYLYIEKYFKYSSELCTNPQGFRLFMPEVSLCTYLTLIFYWISTLFKDSE